MEKRVALELRGRNPSQVNVVYFSIYWNVLSIRISSGTYYVIRKKWEYFSNELAFLGFL